MHPMILFAIWIICIIVLLWIFYPGKPEDKV